MYVWILTMSLEEEEKVGLHLHNYFRRRKVIQIAA